VAHFLPLKIELIETTIAPIFSPARYTSAKAGMFGR